MLALCLLPRGRGLLAGVSGDVEWLLTDDCSPGSDVQASGKSFTRVFAADRVHGLRLSVDGARVAVHGGRSAAVLALSFPAAAGTRGEARVAWRPPPSPSWLLDARCVEGGDGGCTCLALARADGVVEVHDAPPLANATSSSLTQHRCVRVSPAPDGAPGTAHAAALFGRSLASLTCVAAPAYGPLLVWQPSFAASPALDSSVGTPAHESLVLGGEEGRPQPRARLGGHSGAARRVAIRADGRAVAACGDDRSVRVWLVGVAPPPPPLAPRTALAAPGSTHALPPSVTLFGHTGRVWDVVWLVSSDTQEGAHLSSSSAASLPRARPSSAPHHLASCGEDGAPRVWSLAGGGACVAALRGAHRGGVWRLAAAVSSYRSDDNDAEAVASPRCATRLLVSGGANGGVVAWAIPSSPAPGGPTSGAQTAGEAAAGGGGGEGDSDAAPASEGARVTTLCFAAHDLTEPVADVDDGEVRAASLLPGDCLLEDDAESVDAAQLRPPPPPLPSWQRESRRGEFVRCVALVWCGAALVATNGGLLRGAALSMALHRPPAPPDVQPPTQQPLAMATLFRNGGVPLLCIRVAERADQSLCGGEPLTPSGGEAASAASSSTDSSSDDEGDHDTAAPLCLPPDSRSASAGFAPFRVALGDAAGFALVLRVLDAPSLPSSTSASGLLSHAADAPPPLRAHLLFRWAAHAPSRVLSLHWLHPAWCGAGGGGDDDGGCAVATADAGGSLRVWRLGAPALIDHGAAVGNGATLCCSIHTAAMHDDSGGARQSDSAEERERQAPQPPQRHRVTAVASSRSFLAVGDAGGGVALYLRPQPREEKGTPCSVGSSRDNGGEPLASPPPLNACAVSTAAHARRCVTSAVLTESDDRAGFVTASLGTGGADGCVVSHSHTAAWPPAALSPPPSHRHWPSPSPLALASRHALSGLASSVESIVDVGGPFSASFIAAVIRADRLSLLQCGAPGDDASAVELDSARIGGWRVPHDAAMDPPAHALAFSRGGLLTVRVSAPVGAPRFPPSVSDQRGIDGASPAAGCAAAPARLRAAHAGRALRCAALLHLSPHPPPPLLGPSLPTLFVGSEDGRIVSTSPSSSSSVPASPHAVVASLPGGAAVAAMASLSFPSGPRGAPHQQHILVAAGARESLSAWLVSARGVRCDVGGGEVGAPAQPPHAPPSVVVALSIAARSGGSGRASLRGGGGGRLRYTAVCCFVEESIVLDPTACTDAGGSRFTRRLVAVASRSDASLVAWGAPLPAANPLTVPPHSSTSGGAGGGWTALFDRGARCGVDSGRVAFALACFSPPALPPTSSPSSSSSSTASAFSRLPPLIVGGHTDGAVRLWAWEAMPNALPSEQSSERSSEQPSEHHSRPRGRALLAFAVALRGVHSGGVACVAVAPHPPAAASSPSPSSVDAHGEVPVALVATGGDDGTLCILRVVRVKTFGEGAASDGASWRIDRVAVARNAHSSCVRGVQWAAHSDEGGDGGAVASGAVHDGAASCPAPAVVTVSLDGRLRVWALPLHRGEPPLTSDDVGCSARCSTSTDTRAVGAITGWAGVAWPSPACVAARRTRAQEPAALAVLHGWAAVAGGAGAEVAPLPRSGHIARDR